MGPAFQKNSFKFPVIKKGDLIIDRLFYESLLSGSNQRPTDYKSVALPAELRRRFGSANIAFYFFEPKDLPEFLVFFED